MFEDFPPGPGVVIVEGRRLGPTLDLYIREWMNAAWSVFSFLLCVVLAYYLYDQWRRRPVNSRFTIWRDYAHIRLAAAMLVVSFASSMRSTWAWVLLNEQNSRDVDGIRTMATLWPIGVVSAVLGVIGTLYMTYILSRDEWGHRLWVFMFFFGVLTIFSAEFW